MTTRARKKLRMPRVYVIRNRHGFYWQGRDYWTVSPHAAHQLASLATAEDAARTLGGTVVRIRPERLKGGVS